MTRYLYGRVEVLPLTSESKILDKSFTSYRLLLPADPLCIDACPSPSVEAAFYADEILSPFIDTT